MVNLDDRTKDITKMVLKGETYNNIGKKYGITKERVRQIALRGTRELRRGLDLPSRLWNVMLRNNIFTNNQLEELLEAGTFINGCGKSVVKDLERVFNRKVYLNPYSNYFVFEDKRKGGKGNKKVRAAMVYNDVSMIMLGVLTGMNKQTISHYLADELPNDEQERLIQLIEKEGKYAAAEQ